MKLKLLILFFFVSVNAFSQSVLPQYVIVANSFFDKVLIDQLSFQYLCQYSGDSAYVKILERTSKYKYNILAGLQTIKPSQKISRQWQTSDTFQIITINCFEASGLEIIEKAFTDKQFKGEVLYKRIPYLSIKVKVGIDEIEKLIADENVKFINFEHPKIQEINFVERTNHRVSQFAPNFPASAYLTGKGITMGEWDGGDVGKHIDFDSRLTLVKNAGMNSHSTHVAGTMAGAGNLEPDARGMAPEAKIYSWDFNNDIVLEMDTNKNKLGYVLTQNSYGYWTGLCADFAQYDGTSTDMDKMSIKFPDLLHVFAAGNSRSANCVSGGYKTILSGFQSAKNTISVAAVSSTDGDSYFSCAGPTQDGRFKPEISAVGVNVYSTQDNNTYQGGWSGTSMATPGASGSIALIYQKFKAKYGYIPKNYLGKNIMSNTADDIGNIGPDYYFGFGRINGRVAVNLIDSGFWKIDSVANNATYLDTIYIPSNLNEVRVMLTWNDIEVNPSASPILVNDLDLSIIDSAGVSYNPWWCNPLIPSALAIRKRDSINNIEQVTIKNPKGGRVIIKVFGKKIPAGKQAFALTFVKEEKGLTIVYPNGNETMESPSNATKAQTIRWDSKGVTGNYTLEFSRDNGTTWQTIATNIPNTQNYYTWQNLADTVSTGKALIRISNGTKSDVSDNVFYITGLVTGITTLVCDSQVYLRWKSIPKTAFYRVYMLNNGKMVEMGTPTDTSFVITKLNNSKAYWFSISRRGTNGAESQRTVAVSATPTNLNFPPRVTLQPKDTFTCYNNLYFAKSKATGTGTITAKWEYSKNNGITWNSISSLNDSINLKTYTSDFAFTVRRTYTNLCLAPVYTRIASIKLDSLLDVKLYNRDSTVCKNSVLKDSVYVKSKIPSTITWYNDSLTFIKTLQKGLSRSVTNTFSRPMMIWAEVANYCGIVKTKDLTKTTKLNGRNDYTLFPQPQINIKDTLMACLGETININPVLGGGRPGFQKLIIQTEDSTVLKNSISRKITKDQWVTLYYFDNCYPDTTVKKVYIQMRKPLSVALNNDSTICYSNSVLLKAIANGGNGNYTYKWSDVPQNVQSRTVSLTDTSWFKVTLTDNCTEKTVSDSVLITVLPPLDFKLSSSKDTVCTGYPLVLRVTPSGGRVATRIATWKYNNQTGNLTNLYAQKTQWYAVTLSDGCSPVKTDSIYVVLREPLKIKINAMDTLCNGKQTVLSAQVSGGWPMARYVQWKSIGLNGFSVNYTPSATQTIVAVLADGCTFPNAMDTLKVVAYDALKLIKQNDTQTCYGKALTLTVKSIGGKTGTQKYYWQTVRNKTLNADSFSSKTYTYAVADACKDSITQAVNVTVTPKLKIIPSLILKCSDANLFIPFIVNSALPYSIMWDKLPAGKNQIFKDRKSATYIAMLSDGCSDTSMVPVRVVISDFSANYLTIEKVITKTAFVNFNTLPYKTYFNWNDGTQTTGAGNPAAHTYTNYGQYTICRILEDNINCRDTVCETIDNYDPMGFKGYEMKLFPNPVQDQLKFTFNQLSKDVSIQIFDANGKSIYKENLVYPAFAEYIVDVKGIAAGIYTVKVISNGELFVQKFVKVD